MHGENREFEKCGRVIRPIASGRPLHGTRRTALWAEQRAFQKDINCTRKAAAARCGRFCGVEPHDDVAAMARGKRLKCLPGFAMRLQTGAKIGRYGEFARLAVEVNLDADKIAGVGSSSLAQGRVDLRAEAAAAGRD